MRHYQSTEYKVIKRYWVEDRNVTSVIDAEIVLGRANMSFAILMFSFISLKRFEMKILQVTLCAAAPCDFF